MQKIVLLVVAAALLAACSDSAAPPKAAQSAKEMSAQEAQSRTWIVEDKPLPKPRPKQPGQF